MSGLTEAEVLDRHRQSLGEARSICHRLGSQLDPDKAEPRGWLYAALKDHLGRLEGTCRQMHYFREDARWLRLGIQYAKLARSAQRHFIAQRWGAFTKMMPIFEAGLRSVADLAEQKTGKIGPVLPQRPSDWLILPAHDPFAGLKRTLN